MLLLIVRKVTARLEEVKGVITLRWLERDDKQFGLGGKCCEHQLSASRSSRFVPGTCEHGKVTSGQIKSGHFCNS
jgi:hypothetical protein